jgi:hypothetical protein
MICTGAELEKKEDNGKNINISNCMYRNYSWQIHQAEVWWSLISIPGEVLHYFPLPILISFSLCQGGAKR